jgi:hypothetical protein
MITFEENLKTVSERTKQDMEPHIQSSMYLIKNALTVMDKDELLKQIEVMMRTTAELARSYSILNAVTLRLGYE